MLISSNLRWIAMVVFCWLAAPGMVALPVSQGPVPSAAPPVRYGLEVTLNPSSGELAVAGTLTLPPVSGRNTRCFLLHAGLTLDSIPASVKELRRAPRPEDFGEIPARFDPPAGVPRKLYQVTFPAGAAGPLEIALRYRGRIDHPVQAQSEEYARAFSETPGIISADGVYLGASSLWVPWTGHSLITFRLRTTLAGGWDSVSQGDRSGHRLENGQWITEWNCPEPAEEIYLIAGRFTEYQRPAGGITAMAFLRKPDEALAGKYLETTARYLGMYEELIGPFPYHKFALVENFWETGYGMPSFTLLGEKVIRFPFILHSSYPHELLHNYWGNGVFATANSGNWTEGLTTYLADHLIAEQRGQGEEYRRTTLSRYTDYVNTGNDFPLTEFRSRTSAATEAVGYGKAMMMWHMLRRQTGDEQFRQAIRQFYSANGFRRATFGDLSQAFEKVTGRDWQPFFQQWTGRTGAPSLELAAAAARTAGTGCTLDFTLRQTQAEEPFRLTVPLAVCLAGQSKPLLEVVEMTAREQSFRLNLTGQPVRLDIDPAFDLMRRLAREETPPSLSRAFGAGKAMALLPSGAEPALREAYSAMLKDWGGSTAGRLEIRLDSEMSSLPVDRAVWLLGRENRFRSSVEAGLAPFGVKLTANSVQFPEREIMADGNCVVTAVCHPADPALPLVWIAASSPPALPGLGRKLPHYGKYGYLAFEGGEPVNILKGQWPAVGSPLSRIIPEPAGETRPVPACSLPARTALAVLPPPFSAETMFRDIQELASPAMEGRGFGTPGLDRAADYIAGAMRTAGLKPAGDQGSYFQPFTVTGGPENRETVLKNVLGLLPGTNPGWAGQCIVVCAHYDHLGTGWPDVHAGDAGRLHPGADDNASGVAILLELARVLSREAPPARSILFAAFTGEEAGRLGSKHFLEAPGGFPASGIRAALNLDTAGRLGKGKVLILSGASAREWVHIFMGASYVTGVPSELTGQELAASDQASFVERGIPAVQLFTGPHLDYHRPSDTPDQIDTAGLVKVAALAREAIAYLAERPEPLTVAVTTAAGQASSAPGAAPSPPGVASRRASLGTMPDFNFPGPGVKVAAVTPGSPAAAAGILPGDVIVAAGGRDIADLAGYAAVLRAFSPGDKLTVVFVRDGFRHTAEVVLAAR